MNEFEKALLGDSKIPFDEAAHFFIGIKQAAAAETQEKTASMSEAPDETGELEGALSVSPEQFAALLQECIGKAMSLTQAAMIYNASIRGPRACNAKRCFNDWDYKHLVDELSKRSAVLAGAVHLPDIEPPPATTNPEAAIRSMIRGEQELIQCLNAVKDVCGENPFCIRVCNMAANAQSRMDDCWMFLDPESPDPIDGDPTVAGAEVPEDEMPEEAPVEGEEVPEEAAEEVPAEEAPEEAPAEEEVPEEVPEEPETKTAGSVIKLPTGLKAKALKMRAGAKRVASKAKEWRKPGLIGAGLGLTAGSMLGEYSQREKDNSVARTQARETLKSEAKKELKKTSGANPWASARMQASMNKTADPSMGMTQEAPMAAPGTGQQTEPTNYLAAELAGRKAQEQNESSYYRGQVQEAQAKSQAGQAQQQELEGQLQSLQMESQQTQGLVQQSQAQAVAAQDEALRQTQAAANMRMGMQQMRAQLMELASQDPAAQAAQTLQGPAGQPGMGAEEGAVPGSEMEGGPPPQEGAAGQAPDQPMTPGAAPPNGGSVPGGLPAEQAQAPGGVNPAMMAPQGAAGVKAASVAKAFKKVVGRGKELMTGSKAKDYAYRAESLALKSKGSSDAATKMKASWSKNPKDAPSSVGKLISRLESKGAKAGRAATRADGAVSRESKKVLGARVGAAAVATGAGVAATKSLKQDKTAGAMDQLKSRLPGALGGAALGAGYHKSLQGKAPGLRDSVQELEGQEGGGFLKAMQLAKQKTQLAQAERAEQYPGASMALQAGRGALLGASAGPTIQNNIQGALGR